MINNSGDRLAVYNGYENFKQLIQSVTVRGKIIKFPKFLTSDSCTNSICALVKEDSCKIQVADNGQTLLIRTKIDATSERNNSEETA